MDKNIQWQIIRTILFIIIGLFNTVLIRPEDIGSWKNYLGYTFLVIALFDTVSVVRKFIKHKSETKK